MAENKNTTENNKNSGIAENNEQLWERIMEKTQDEFLDDSEENSEKIEEIEDLKNDIEETEEQGGKAESTEDTEDTEEGKEPEEMKEKSAKKKKRSIYSSTLNYISGFTGSLKAVVIAVAVLAIVAVGIFVAVNSCNIKIGESQASFSQEYSMSSQAQFYSCNNSIFFSSKDGMSLLDKKGNTVWTDTFSMTTPVMLSDGEYTAVADKGAKTMNVYNLKGKAYTVNTEGVITTFAINPLGYSVVMCQSSGESDYTAFCYSPDGKVAFKGSYVAKDGLPAAIDISDDGRIIGISFINISRIKIKSKVNFYFVNTEDAKTTDNSDAIFSGVEMDSEVAAIVHFMPDNSCIVSTDSKLYSIGGRITNKENYKENWKIEYPNYVSAFNIVDNKYIAVAYGSTKTITDNSDNVNTVHWYNMRGNEIGSAKFDETITAMYSNMESTIVAMGKVFDAMDVRGKHLWEYRALQTVNSMQLFDSTDRVILATANKMQLFSVKKGANMVEDNEALDPNGEDTSVETTTASTTTAQTTSAS